MQTLKNMSVLRMAAAHQPDVPTRLYKPLTHWKLIWMRKKVDAAKAVLGWSPDSIAARARLGTQELAHKPTAATLLSPAAAAALAASSKQHPGLAFASRVRALAAQLEASSEAGKPL